MWDYAWGLNHESDDIPIGSITNAVHVPYWQKPMLRQLIEAEGGIDKVGAIDDEKIWVLHVEFKNKLRSVSSSYLGLRAPLIIINDGY